MVCIFEKFTRALVRQFTLGVLGQDAGKNVSYISFFIFLMDKDLEKTDYINKKFLKAYMLYL